MTRILVAIVLVSTIPFFGCVETRDASTFDNASSSTQLESSSEVGDPHAESLYDEPAAIVFGDKFPKVLEAEATPNDDGNWRFSVTLSSPFDSPERYADAWRVLDEKDQQLGIRELGHDHANEQPFTRSGAVQIPQGTGTVFIEGRDQLNGWSGQRFEFKIPSS